MRAMAVSYGAFAMRRWMVWAGPPGSWRFRCRRSAKVSDAAGSFEPGLELVGVEAE